MTRDEWKAVLFAHVHDEVAQDALNDCYTAIKAENARLRELAKSLNDVAQELYVMVPFMDEGVSERFVDSRALMRELGIEVDDD